MFKRLPLTGLLVLLLSAAAFAQAPTAAQPQDQPQPPAQAPAPAGMADEVRGEVTAGFPGARARKLAAKEVVYNGETVATGPKASVQVRLADGTLLSLGEQSSVEIVDAAYDPARPDSASAVCRLGRGVFRCLTGEVTAKEPDRFRLETPLAVIGVRGTELGVTVGADSVETAVFSGGPGFVTDREGGPPVQMLAGQGLNKARGVALGQAAAISGRLRSLVARVPLRMTPNGPRIPPGMTRGKPSPPRLAEALKASGLRGVKGEGLKGSKDAAKAAAKTARGRGNEFKAAGGKGGGFKTFEDKIKNAAKAAGRAVEGAAKGTRDAIRGSGGHRKDGATGGAGKPGRQQGGTLLEGPGKSGSPGREQPRQLQPSGRDTDFMGKPGGGEGKGGGGGKR